jgi:hypothetical protein
LEPNRIQHARGSLAKPGRRGAVHGFAGEAFNDDTAEAIEVNQVCKLDAIAKRPAGCENGIPQAHRADMHGQINGTCARHFARKSSMNALLQTMISIVDSTRKSG